MNILTQIIERLNQKINAANIFDQFYGISEFYKDEKAYYYYIGDGQALPVTNYDSKQGTIFWVRRGRTIISKQENLRLTACKFVYDTRFILTAYCMVRKSHLPCDSAEAIDWIASKIFKLTSGKDVEFKESLGVIAYEVIPNGYQIDSKVLTPNLEWAAVAVDIDVVISTFSEDGCYDVC